MKAMGIEQYGGPEAIIELELDQPKVAPDGVLVRIAAAGVNPVDYKVRAGGLDGAFPTHFPLVLGWDAAGVVEQVGPAVTAFEAGDRVLGYCRKHWLQEGTYAEYVAVPDRFLAKLPEGVDLHEAGGLPLAGLTAHQAIERMGVREGQMVLVHAAAGGVGHLATQLAADRGATVLGTASAGNHDALRRNGVAHPIDYREEDVVAAVRELAPDGLDAVFDLLGGETQQESLRMLRSGGVLISIAEPPDPQACADAGVRGGYVFVRPSGWQLAELVSLWAQDRLHVDVEELLPLEEAAQAQSRSEEGHVRGKLILRVD